MITHGGPHPATVAHRGPNRRALTRAACLTIAGLLVGSTAPGYRFYLADRNGSLIADTEGAMRWRASRWRAGEAQEWILADSPFWTEPFVYRWDEEGETQPPPFANTADALPFVREAMAAWSAIPTADILWNLSGVESVSGLERDRQNTFVVTDDLGVDWAAGVAWTWDRQSSSGDWELDECDIGLIPGAAAWLGAGESTSLVTTIHEFGHCIGLDHAATHSMWPATYRRDLGVFGGTPIMSYGGKTSNDLTVDDIVGASLLRPAGDWTERTGVISGRVTVAGEPAEFVAVGSVYLGTEGVTPGPGVFTNEDGEFRLEGLVPGEYLIRAGPMISVNAHSELVKRGALQRAADGARLRPITVRAGEETDEVSLELPPDRPSTREVRR